MSPRFFISSFFCLALAVPATAAESIPIINKSGVAVHLWFWKADEQRWNRPPLALGPHQTVTVTFSGESYYLVAQTRTREPQEIRLGWIAPGALKRRAPSVSLALDGSWITETKAEAYTIARPAWETRVRKVPIIRWYWGNGRWYSRTEVVEETYKICRVVTEQRTRNVQTERLELTATARDASGPLMSQVTFTTQMPGAFIKYQLVARDEVERISSPTNTTERIGVGTYYVWTERNDKPSSRRQHYDIYERAVSITIPETSTAQ